MSGNKSMAEDGKPPAEVRKGERLGFDKTVAIHLYPETYEISTPSDKPEEATFNVIDDYRGSRRDKSNMGDVTIPKLEQLSNNAEAYCQLLERLWSEKWIKEDPKMQDIFLKARDFQHCILHPLAAPAYKAAMEALILKIMKCSDENEHAKSIGGVPWKIGTLMKDGLNGVQEYLTKYKETFASFALGSDDPEQAKEYLEEEYWEELARMVFREPYRAYETQLSYLMHDIRKPYNVSFTDYKARVEQVFGYLTSFPALSLRNKEPLPDDIDKRNTPIKPNIIREVLYNSLPKTWRDEFERRETVDVREVSELIFIDIMLKIEEEDNTFRAKSAEGRNNNNNQSNGNSRGTKRSRDSNNGNGNQKKRSHDENKKHKKKNVHEVQRSRPLSFRLYQPQRQ